MVTMIAHAFRVVLCISVAAVCDRSWPSNPLLSICRKVLFYFFITLFRLLHFIRNQFLNFLILPTKVFKNCWLLLRKLRIIGLQIIMRIGQSLGLKMLDLYGVCLIVWNESIMEVSVVIWIWSRVYGFFYKSIRIFDTKIIGFRLFI